MNRSRTLLFFLGVFAVITVLFIWAQYFDGQTHFLAGTNPPRAPELVVPPRLPPLRPTDPIRGGVSDDVVTIVEFSDFTCPACRAVQPELTKVLQEMGPRVRLVWRDLPLGQESPVTIIATLAGRCAKEQGKFWEMHDQLFQAQKMDIPSLSTLASKIGLNSTTFNTCLSSTPQLQQIQEDLRIADSFNIKASPVFFIGREVFNGYVTAAQLKASVDRAVFKK